MPDPSPHHHTTGLSLQLFGPLDVRIDGDPLPHLRSRRGYWLLALLVLRHGREVERAWLAGTLWPESDEAQALSSLRRTLTDLRSALGREAGRLSSPTSHTVRLSIEGAFADVTAFDEGIARGDPSSLARAVSLYRGSLLEGCHEEWAQSERESREQACIEALDSLGRLAAERSDSAAAAKHFRRAISLDSFRESSCRALMEALAAQGDYAAMALTYRDIRDRLRRDMNADPSPETVALFHRLQDEARTELAAARPQSGVPKDGDSVPGFLPRPITTFIGREKELDEIVRLLAASRLLTITGTGGIGKTRLAIRAAEETAHEFPDGVWFVDLAPITNAALAPQAVARLMDVAERPHHTLVETLCNALMLRNLLLVFDNCEHLAEAAAELAKSLVEACPGVTIMATSRQPLCVEGEIVWRAPSLDVPEPRNLPSADEGLAFILPQYAAARLFVERAASAMPTFALTERTAPAVLRIIRRLDGLPLAIELAAARIRVLSAQQIASRLDDRFRLLTRGNPTAMPRQQTLLAAIDWSYDLLSEDERSLLRRLAVFSGGWTLEAAEATFRNLDWQVLDVLSDLIDKSLVVAEEDAGGGRRYRMLETVREYALERLKEAGEEPEWRNRHFDYCLELAEEGATHPSGDLSQYWFERIETEHDNVRAALQHAPSPEQLAQMSRSMYWFWNSRGQWHEGRLWMRRSLDAYRTSDTLRAKVLCAAGLLSWRCCDFSAALTLLEESLEIYRRENDVHSIGSIVGNMGLVYGDLGDYVSARRCHERCLEIRREEGARQSIANVLTNLGLVSLYEADYSAARANLEEATEIYRELGAKRGLASALINLGLVYLREGDLVHARKCNEECAAMSRELSHKSKLGYALHGLAQVSCEEGDLAGARAFFKESLAIRREMAEQNTLADSLVSIGDLLLKEGNHEVAVRLWAAANKIYTSIGSHISVPDQLDSQANEGAAKEAMGQKAFDRAWEVGRSWTIEQSLDEAERAVD